MKPGLIKLLTKEEMITIAEIKGRIREETFDEEIYKLRDQALAILENAKSRAENKGYKNCSVDLEGPIEIEGASSFKELVSKLGGQVIRIDPTNGSTINPLKIGGHEELVGDKTMYRLITVDTNQRTEIHWFEAHNHEEAIEHSASYMKVSERNIWSARVLTAEGTLMSDRGQLIEEEKIMAENEKFMREEFGICKLELGKEAYDLFSQLYQLSHNHPEILEHLLRLKMMHDKKKEA